MNWIETTNFILRNTSYEKFIPIEKVFQEFKNGGNLNPSIPFSIGISRDDIEHKINTFLSTEKNFTIPKTKKRKKEHVLNRVDIQDFSRIQQFDLAPYSKVYCYSSNKITTDLGESNFIKFKDNRNISITIGKNPQLNHWTFVFCSNCIPHAGFLNSNTLPFPLYTYKETL